jgi:Tol biopolymer transport system component
LVVAALAMLLATLGAGSARAQYFGQNKIQYEMYHWRSISSDHFEVYFYEGSDSLAMRTLDLAEKTNVVFSKRLGHKLSRKIPIIVYGSHNDFSQTNTINELIDSGTGGFTEPLRDRVVVPFTGSYEDYRHVLVHELTHAFQFDILYNGTGMSLLSGQGLFQMPLWFAEGMAEYFSLGMESNAEMWCRDGALAGYIPPLQYAGGYPVYKFGQSAIAFLIQRYGDERFRDLLKRARQMRNFDRAFERTYGLSVEKFDEKWRTDLRKKYWPTVAEHELPETYGRRLTDHRKDQSTINISPAVSPQGDRIAYYSDRRQYSDIYVMSAFDGKVLHRVIRGERDVQFESMPLFRSALTWSPDGQRLAMTAKSRGRDQLYVVDAHSGKVLKDFSLPCEALEYPAWSPVSDSIVVTGLKDGRSDLYLVNSRTGQISRLTNDTWDEKEPTWSPDGSRVTFSSDRGAPVVLQTEPSLHGYGHYGLYDLDVATGQITKILDTAGEDHSPAWSPDGKRLAFVSDRDGAPNIYLYDASERTVTQLTDVLGGVVNLSWSHQNDRLVFSAFDRLGWDIFAVQEPLTSPGVLAGLRRHLPASVLSLEAAETPAAPETLSEKPHGALASAWPDSTTMPDSSYAMASRRREAPRATLPPVANEPPAWTGDLRPINGQAPMAAAIPDTAPGLPETTPLHDNGGPFALSDTVLGQHPAPYHWKLGAESANGGFAAATGYGFIGSTSLLFSDFLGDRNLYIAADVNPGSLEETNALAIYSYLPRRWDWSTGVFHFKNYFQSRVTTLGEQLQSAQVFSERTFGGLAQWSYPFSQFRRTDLGFTQMFVQRTFYFQDQFGSYVKGNSTYRSVTSPSVSLVGDNSLASYYGPVNGSRYNVTYAPAIAIFNNSLGYHTVTFDYRKYWDLTSGYTFAFRSLDAGSWGRDPQAFRIGGFSTLRGFPDFDLIGSRFALVNAELRFPFIQQLGLVGPVPLGNFNLRGAVFSDAGLVWNQGDPLRLTVVDDRGRRLGSPDLSFGTGIRSFVLFALFKLDVAWHTNLRDVSRPRWHFSIGPEF